MKELERLVESEVNKEKVQKLKYAMYLYKELLTDSNRQVLDEYTNTLIDVLKHKNGFKNIKNLSNYILDRFYLFLINSGKTEKTAYDYVKRIERICREYEISEEDLFSRRSCYSINDLIGMFSPGGIKSEENKKKHNGPLSALKQFKIFMELPSDEFSENPFYLCDAESYQSFEIMNKHVSIIEIRNKKCTLIYKENREICDEVIKIINDSNYRELLHVFKKYKSILSHSMKSHFQAFPHGGVHSFDYQFEDQLNLSHSPFLFESNDRELVEKAYAEYRRVINKIIKQ